MSHIWSLKAALKTSAVEEGLFIFEFRSVAECNMIMFKQPWNFNGALLIFNRLDGDKCPSDLMLNLVSFWVQIHGLQLD